MRYGKTVLIALTIIGLSVLVGCRSAKKEDGKEKATGQQPTAVQDTKPVTQPTIAVKPPEPPAKVSPPAENINSADDAAVKVFGAKDAANRPEATPAAKDVTATPDAVLFKPGESCGSVRLGMSSDELSRVMGKPEEIQGKGWRYPAAGLTVVVENDGKVSRVSGGAKTPDHPEIHAFRGRTPEGIGMGSAEEDVRKAYGSPTTESRSGSAKTASYVKLHMAIMYIDGRIVWISTYR